MGGRGELGLVAYADDPLTNIATFLPPAGHGGELVNKAAESPGISYAICGKYHTGNALSWRPTDTDPIKDGLKKIKREEKEFDIKKPSYRWNLEIDCMTWEAT